MVYFDNIYSKFSSSIFYRIFRFFIDVIKMFFHKLKHILSIVLIVFIAYLLFGDKISQVKAASINNDWLNTKTIADSWLNNYQQSLRDDVSYDIIFGAETQSSGANKIICYYYQWASLDSSINLIQANFALSNTHGNFEFRSTLNGSSINSGTSIHCWEMTTGVNGYKGWNGNTTDIGSRDFSFLCRTINISENYTYYVYRTHLPIYSYSGVKLSDIVYQLPTFRNPEILEHIDSGQPLFTIDFNDLPRYITLDTVPFTQWTEFDVVARINGEDYHLPILDNDWCFIDPRGDTDPQFSDKWILCIPKYFLFQNGFFDKNMTIQIFFEWKNSNSIIPEVLQHGIISTDVYNFSEIAYYQNMSSDDVNNINNRVGGTFQAVQTKIAELQQEGFVFDSSQRRLDLY